MKIPKLLLFLLFSCMACQKETEPAPNKGKLRAMVEKIDESTQTTTDFVYDLTGKLSQVNTYFVENGALKTSKKEEFVRNSQGNVIKIKTTYNANNQQTETEKLIEIDEEDKRLKITEFSKTTRNRTIEQIKYATDELGIERPTFYDKLELRPIRDTLFAFVPIESQRFLWQQGNIATIKVQNLKTTSIQEVAYTYEKDMPNPLNVLYENELKIPMIAHLSKNQVVSITETPDNQRYKYENFSTLFRLQKQILYKQAYGKWTKQKEVSYQYW